MQSEKKIYSKSSERNLAMSYDYFQQFNNLSRKERKILKRIAHARTLRLKTLKTCVGNYSMIFDNRFVKRNDNRHIHVCNNIVKSEPQARQFKNDNGLWKDTCCTKEKYQHASINGKPYVKKDSPQVGLHLNKLSGCSVRDTGKGICILTEYYRIAYPVVFNSLKQTERIDTRFAELH
jgi:hypothetical protein